MLASGGRSTRGKARGGFRGQLNLHEQRHSLARAVFFGKKGEVRKRYREGQEDQLGALGLVVNAVSLWNTRYVGLALDALASEGFEARVEDVERLSPLRHEHVNLLGRYQFSLAEDLLPPRGVPRSSLTFPRGVRCTL